MGLNFLTGLISKLSFDVFRPDKTTIVKTIIGILGFRKTRNVPSGLLYVLLSAVSREISGICPWDTGDGCFRGYDAFWSLRCRNMPCPGYRHPWGLIAYTSRSAPLSSVDNRFDYSSFREMTTDDYIPVGTLGVQTFFDWGGWNDPGGYGAYYYGALYYGDNSFMTPLADIYIGDKWYISVTKDITGQWVVGPPVPDPGNRGTYGPILTKGPYIGDYETTYTIEIIDFWGYVQNFQDAILEMCLSTCKDVWLDFWGDYFGIRRLQLTGSPETDSDYRARIMREITRAKGTRPVLLEEAQNYFKSDLVTITEYHQTGAVSVVLGSDNLYYTCILNHVSDPTTRPVTGINWQTCWELGGLAGNTWTSGVAYNIEILPRWDGPVLTAIDPARGLWPYQFYINIPTQKSPSAKFIKSGINLQGDGKFYSYDVSTGYATPTELTHVHAIGGGGDLLLPSPGVIGDFIVFGSTSKFSGIYMVLLVVGVGGTFIWEYWNGAGWTALVTNGAAKSLSATGYVFWKIPTPYDAWVAADSVAYNIPNTGIQMFWVRCRTTAVPAIIPLGDYLAIVYAGATCRGSYCGTGVLPVPPGTYDPTKRDKNNCYVYSSNSWEKPMWDSGLQEIIDRIKTAGTAAIINSLS